MSMKMSWDEDREAAENWREVATYFADVLAASASILLDRKSTPKSERRRQASILRTALLSMRTGQLIGGYPHRDPAPVIARLERMEAAARAPADPSADTGKETP